MDFGLYVIITKPALSYRQIAEICVKQEIKYLQLREKDLTDKELLRVAIEIQQITKNTKTCFIVNDRIDICLLSGADGVHLGQEDIDFKFAGSILPKNKIIGLSTHNFEQAKLALRHRPDYIGFGPIYKTPTKKNPDTVVGCEKLKSVLTFADIPVVAIGGIDDTNIGEVLATGVKNICMVRYLMETTDLEYRILKIKELLDDASNKSKK